MRWAAASSTTTCPAIRKIVRDAARDNYRFSSIVMGIVKAPAFQSSMVESAKSRQPAPSEVGRQVDREGVIEMFITKKHLTRRTLLRGAGAPLALPLLDAMIPARTALAQTAAKPTPHLGFIYFPHGAVHGPVDADGRRQDRRVRRRS